MHRIQGRRDVLWAALPVLALAPVCAGAAEQQAYVPMGDIAVNLPRGGDVPAFVVVTVVIEATTDGAAAVKANALRIREAILFRLMAMSQRKQLEMDTLDPLLLKDALYQAVTRVQRDGVRDVLIQRIVRN
jgi:hypothetical protein